MVNCCQLPQLEGLLCLCWVGFTPAYSILEPLVYRLESALAGGPLSQSFLSGISSTDFYSNCKYSWILTCLPSNPQIPAILNFGNVLRTITSSFDLPNLISVPPTVRSNYTYWLAYLHTISSCWTSDYWMRSTFLTILVNAQKITTRPWNPDDLWCRPMLMPQINCLFCLISFNYAQLQPDGNLTKTNRQRTTKQLIRNGNRKETSSIICLR